MSEPIPHQPEDALFPADWKRFDQFLQIFTTGGDVGVSPVMPSPLPQDDGRPSSLVAHMDRGERYLVTRIDADTFIVRRKPV